MEEQPLTRVRHEVLLVGVKEIQYRLLFTKADSTIVIDNTGRLERQQAISQTHS